MVLETEKMTISRKHKCSSSSSNTGQALPLHHSEAIDASKHRRKVEFRDGPKVATSTQPRKQHEGMLSRSDWPSSLTIRSFHNGNCQTKPPYPYHRRQSVSCSREYIRNSIAGCMRRLWNIIDHYLFFSKLTRLLIWSLALIIMFTMERRRTFQRMKHQPVATRVISGMLVETPDDLLFDAAKFRPSSFLPVPTQRNPIQDGQIDICAHCQIHYPYCDLHEFTVKQLNLDPNHNWRLKQIDGDDFHTSERFGLLTQRGIGISHLKGNMDRSILVKPYHPLKESNEKNWNTNFQQPVNEENEDENDFLLLLLDGHGPGGADVAQWAMHNAPKILTHEVNKAWESIRGTSIELHQLIIKVMTRTFHKVHDGIAKRLLDSSSSSGRHQAESSDKDSLIAHQLVSGTTLCLAFQWKEMLHIANVGDSQAFVVSYDRREADRVKFIYATRPDKIELPNERQRVFDNGGSLWIPPTRGEPKLFLQLTKGNSTASDNDESANQRTPSLQKSSDINQETDTMDFVLGVSRSLGDLAAHEMGVISEPIVASIPLNSHDENTETFLMMASNGLLDKMAPLAIARRFAENFAFEDRMLSPVEIMEGIFLDANVAWKKSRVVKDGDHLVEYRDDVTLAVVRL